jgi:hypothetical protein
MLLWSNSKYKHAIIMVQLLKMFYSNLRWLLSGIVDLGNKKLS